MAKNELRENILTNELVIIAGERAKRPVFFQKIKQRKLSRNCPFCPGNEDKTTGTQSIVKNKRWVVRSIKNKYPIVVDNKIKSIPIRDFPFYTHYPISGNHEVIIETREHNKEAYNMGVEQMRNVIDMFVERYSAMISSKDAKFVSIFKNRGEEAGASISHPHSQIISLPIIPKKILVESKKMGKKCVMCEIVEEKERTIYENTSFTAMCPYAPKFPYEVWIISKKHIKSILEMGEKEKNDLADIMCVIFRAMENFLGEFPYNYSIHQAPKGRNFHFHIEIYPRLSKLAGLEIGSSIYVNIMPPEKACAEIIKNL